MHISKDLHKAQPPLAERVLGALLAVVIASALALIMFHGLSGGFRP